MKPTTATLEETYWMMLMVGVPLYEKLKKRGVTWDIPAYEKGNVNMLPDFGPFTKQVETAVWDRLPLDHPHEDKRWQTGAHMQLLAEHLIFDSFGRNVFMFTPGMLSAFERTTVSKEMANEIRLPYPAFSIERSTDGTFLVVLGLDAKGAPACDFEHLILSSAGSGGKPSSNIVDRAHFCEFAGQQESLATWVANTVLYAQSGGEITTEEPSNSPALRKLERKLKHVQTQSKAETLIRRITKLRPGRLHVDAMTGVSGDLTLRGEHWVMGHWRGYWYGPKATQEKRIRWRRPHKRCVGNGPTVHERVYTATGEEE